MFYYEGLSCPVCKKAFQSEDDIVVCPQCGLPHHRSCWQSIGHCYAAEQHGTAQQWSRDRDSAQTSSDAEDASPSEQTCPHCKTKNVKYAEFCTRCGRALTAEDWHSATPKAPYVGEYSPYGQSHEGYSSTERIGETNAADLAAVVSNNCHYYIPRFRRIEQSGRGGWNWAAFILSPIWLFYRKQYKLGILYFVMQLLSNVATSIVYAPVQTAKTDAAVEAALAEIVQDPLFFLAAALSFIYFALQVLLGIRANHFYLRHCETKIIAEREKVSDLSASELSAVGGVSPGLAVLCYVISSVLLDAIMVIINTFI